MTRLRVLRIYHSAVVDEFRQRERLLRERHGHDVHVVCPPEWPEGGSTVRPTVDAHTPVHVVDTWGPDHPILFWYRFVPLRRVVHEVQPDILDIHEEPYSAAASAALVAAARAAPAARVCVYSAQNLLKRNPPPFGAMEARVLRRAVAAYPCSQEAGARLRTRGFRGAVHVIPLGVTMARLTPRSPGPARVGFIGRLEPYKGGGVALESFAQATEGHEATLDVIGGGSDRAALVRLADHLGIVDRVRFHGPLSQEETLTRLKEFDIVLVPSLQTPTWKEQFGRVPAQAFAAGAAVIASDSGSLREVVGDGGLLVREGDTAGFAGALRELIVDPGARAEIAERGRRRAQQHLTWERVSDMVDVMYRQAIGEAL